MGTFIVSLILVLIVSAILINEIRNVKQGKSSCAEGCASCTTSCSGGSCPSAEKMLNGIEKISRQLSKDESTHPAPHK